ncbi:unnamed protein product [Didymodactylos carnosus]|uniref:Uncharacterized protein n=1 Tax=Didymodactylos carnosus TaxID=1234261 RepID=A0A815GVA3_9BILA|nr:unnamed protein product [Didymodactylos carnosus]CAF1343493.1 unnamed protein product [Didymodactylos carnosus]CAF3807043.1 unnamed protein product [Didymodactylos carnosus]CAF4207071.1 unnamed protein product [Didymodactylos carnosus]
MSHKSWIFEILCKSPIDLDIIVDRYELTKFRTEYTSVGVKYTYRCASYKKLPSFAMQLQAKQLSMTDVDTFEMSKVRKHDHIKQALATCVSSFIRDDGTHKLPNNRVPLGKKIRGRPKKQVQFSSVYLQKVMSSTNCKHGQYKISQREFCSQQTSSGLKLLYRCSSYKKYPDCDFQIQATIDDFKQISVNTSKQHNHDARAASSRVPSHRGEIVKKSVVAKLTKSQARLTIQNEHSETVPSSQFTSLLLLHRSLSRPAIYSVDDLFKSIKCVLFSIPINLRSSKNSKRSLFNLTA